jgi:hypothetical protein
MWRIPQLTKFIARIDHPIQPEGDENYKIKMDNNLARIEKDRSNFKI